MRDLRGQKKIRAAKEMLNHLKAGKLEPTFSAGVWYFYPPGGRFHEPYIQKGTIKDILGKIGWMRGEGYIDSSFRIEAHYPNLSLIHI